MKRLKLIWYLLILPMTGMAQQDANFTQYVFNTLHVNPAYAGYKNNLYIQSTYRQQWNGVDGAPKSFSLAADALLANKKVGLSLMISSDKIGVQKSLGIYGGYAYHVKIGEQNTRLSFGLNVGLLQTSINGASFVPNEDGDTFIPITNDSNILPDAKLGVLFSTEHFFTGISASNAISNLSIGKKRVTGMLD